MPKTTFKKSTKVVQASPAKNTADRVVTTRSSGAGKSALAGSLDFRINVGQRCARQKETGMIRRYLVLLLALALAGLPSPAAQEASADIVQPTQTLIEALLFAEAAQILREEGLVDGQDLIAELPDGPDRASWGRVLDHLYNPARIVEVFSAEMARELTSDPQLVAEATGFFASEIGARALRLELSARRAMLDDDVEAAAQLAYDELAGLDPARQELIDRFVLANDLVESNVMGALNANLAFLRGLAETGGERFAMAEADMLAQVWGAETETRAEMTGWLLPFLTLAYQPLSDAELQAYIAFSESPAGQRVNAAMFRAFDVLFVGISRDLGRALGRTLQGDDI